MASSSRPSASSLDHLPLDELALVVRHLDGPSQDALARSGSRYRRVVRDERPPMPAGVHWRSLCGVAAGAGDGGRLLRWALEHGAPCRHADMVRAAAAGHVGALERMAAVAVDRDDEGRSDERRRELYEAAARGGHLDVLEWLASEYPGEGAPEGAVLAAAEHGHVEALAWLIEYGGAAWSARSLWRAAARGGHVAVLEWVEGLLGGTEDAASLYAVAAEAGQVGAMAWLRERGYAWDARACHRAAEAGQVGALAWLHERGGCVWEASLCAAAASGGQLEALVWLRAQSPPCPWDTSVSDAAVHGGHGRLFSWLRRHGCPTRGLRALLAGNNPASVLALLPRLA